MAVAEEEFTAEPRVEGVGRDSLIGEPARLCSWDLLTLPVNAASTAAASWDIFAERLDGVCCWFDVVFDAADGRQVELSTSPFQPRTHWHQCIFFFRKVLPRGLYTASVRVEAAENGWIRVTASLPRSADDDTGELGGADGSWLLRSYARPGTLN